MCIVWFGSLLLNPRSRRWAFLRCRLLPRLRPREAQKRWTVQLWVWLCFVPPLPAIKVAPQIVTFSNTITHQITSSHLNRNPHMGVLQSTLEYPAGYMKTPSNPARTPRRYHASTPQIVCDRILPKVPSIESPSTFRRGIRLKASSRLLDSKKLITGLTWLVSAWTKRRGMVSSNSRF